VRGTADGAGRRGVAARRGAQRLRIWLAAEGRGAPQGDDDGGEGPGVAGSRGRDADMLERTRPDLRLLLIAGGSPRSRDEVHRMNALLKLLKPPTVTTTYIQPNGEHFTKDLKKLVPMTWSSSPRICRGRQAARNNWPVFAI
jgi:hypothetical protein